MMRLTEIIGAAAFTVADSDYPGVLAAVSGPYVTFWQEVGGTGKVAGSGLYDAPAALNPVHHSEGGTDGSGLYEISAADLYDEALGLLRDFATGSGIFGPEEEEVPTAHWAIILGHDETRVTRTVIIAAETEDEATAIAIAEQRSDGWTAWPEWLEAI